MLGDVFRRMPGLQLLAHRVAAAQQIFPGGLGDQIAVLAQLIQIAGLVSVRQPGAEEGHGGGYRTDGNSQFRQIVIQMPLFQNPQARAVWFHITLAPGAHDGGAGGGGAHGGGGPHGPQLIGAGPPARCQSWH